MKLLRTYIKLMVVRNKWNYLLVILSIIATYVTMAVIMVYIDNFLILSDDYINTNFRHLYISIRTVFLSAGAALVISQYYNIMKSSLRDYFILKSLGATRYNIRLLIFIQAVFLIVITIPFGFLSGHILTKYMISFMNDFALNNNTTEIMDSTSTFFFIAGITCLFIITIGVHLERGVRNMPLGKIMADNTVIGKEV
jgi:ABC-type antimicrobial peptide transport system permease subunit